MKIFVRFVVPPILILVACGAAARWAWMRSPALVLTALASLVLLGLTEGYLVRRWDMRRGWRAGRVGRDQMFYEELILGKWERIPIDGEMLVGGTSHHVIYFPSASEWQGFPEWARGRQEEITARIKETFKPPGYEYEYPRSDG